MQVFRQAFTRPFTRAFILLAAVLGAPSVSMAASNFTQINPPGPHAVGLKIVEQYDYARGYRGKTDPLTGKTLTGEAARPVQTLIWYPAVTSAKPGMTVADYVRIGASDDDFDHTPAERADLAARAVQRATEDLPPERAQAELAAPMLAHRDAAAEAGKFPVVIYAPSQSAEAAENADLCEYLASQGYIVIASPSVGASSRPMTQDLAGAETQAADIGFLIGYAHSLPQADVNHIAVVGYSRGGLAGMLAAAKDPRIDARVSLDGSERYYPALLKQAAYATEARATAPLLFLARPSDEFEAMPPIAPNHDTSPLNHMKYADLYRVTLAPMDHWYFNTLFGQRLLADQDYEDYDKDELSTATAWMQTYVLRFLDAYLKGDAKSLDFLNLPPARTGAPAHLMTTRVTHAVGAPPTPAAFAAELNRRGFDKASEAYQAFKTRDPDFGLSDEDFLYWGDQLLNDGDLVRARAVFRLDTEVHPDRWLAFDFLGKVCTQAGDKACAIAAYRQSLVLNPQNAHATEQLKALDAKAG